jgi:hypothetical protein
MSHENKITQIEDSGRKVTSKDRLRSILEANPDEHYTLRNLVDLLGGDISRERVRVLRIELREEGSEFITDKEFRRQTKEKNAKEKREKTEKRETFLSKVKGLIFDRHSGPEINNILANEDKPIGVDRALNVLREKDKIPRQRRRRRDREEISITDATVKELYEEGLSFREIMRKTNLDLSQISGALSRLSRQSAIKLRRQKN